MIDWFVSILREYPPVALFLTIGLGFLLGRIRFGSFQLGSVTSVLLVGVLVGQLVIPVSGPLKMFFFMLFLFSIGYKVGPDFFKSLRGSGARQALFAVCMSAMCFGVTLLLISFRLQQGRDCRSFLRFPDMFLPARSRQRGNTQGWSPEGGARQSAEHNSGMLCGDVHIRHTWHSNNPRQFRTQAVGWYREGETAHRRA